MESQKFELELRMTDKGIVCNAQMLLAMLPEKLKPYNYIVDGENKDKAKSDRAKLNNLVKLLQTERKEFETREIGEWQRVKATLMEIEKTIKKSADDLGDGIKNIDQNEAIKKKENIKQAFELFVKSNNLDTRISFDFLYDEKEYAKKSVTEEKALIDLQNKISQIQKDLTVIDTVFAEQEKVLLENYYFQSYDLLKAKEKLDEFKENQARQEKIKQAQEEKAKAIEELRQAETPKEEVIKQPTLESVSIVQVVTATMEAPREFFDELNLLVRKYKAKVKVTSRCTKEV